MPIHCPVLCGERPPVLRSITDTVSPEQKENRIFPSSVALAHLASLRVSRKFSVLFQRPLPLILHVPPSPLYPTSLHSYIIILVYIWESRHVYIYISWLKQMSKKKENRENFSPDLHRLNSIRYPVSNVHPSPRIAHVNRGEKKDWEVKWSVVHLSACLSFDHLLVNK